MGLREILLILVGVVIFVISFLAPTKREEQSEEAKELEKEEVKALVNQELERVRNQMEQQAEESFADSYEKTELTVERLTNEKIMAINEYSDTVLEEIHKSHTEVMFLYDMLNDKYENLKSTAVEVAQTAKAVRITSEEIKQEQMKQTMPVDEPANLLHMPQNEEIIIGSQMTVGDQIDIPFTESETENSNEDILRLHKEGKSKVDIAKELGLGVGEVKLVIDLFEGM